MLVATAISFTAYFGAFGPDAKSLSAFISLGVAIVLPPVVAWATHGKYYIARPAELPADEAKIACVKCAEDFPRLDMATCPFHQGTICSLCCSTDGACHDECKKPDGEHQGTARRVLLGIPRVPQPGAALPGQARRGVPVPLEPTARLAEGEGA
jgi:hypothetical protein